TITWTSGARIAVNTVGTIVQTVIDAPAVIALAKDDDVFVAVEGKESGANNWYMIYNQCSPTFAGCGANGDLDANAATNADRWFPVMSPVDGNQMFLIGKDGDANNIFRPF